MICPYCQQELKSDMDYDAYECYQKDHVFLYSNKHLIDKWVVQIMNDDNSSFILVNSSGARHYDTPMSKSVILMTKEISLDEVKVVCENVIKQI